MTTTDNSWVLITGASSGSGEEFAHQYAQQGRSLVLVARRLDRLQALAEVLRRQYRIDIVVEQAISRMLRQSSNCKGASASKALQSTAPKPGSRTPNATYSRWSSLK